MDQLNLSFSDWGYIEINQNVLNRCCWGTCGLLANSIGNVLNIYSEDNKTLYPIRNWCARSNSIITMAWYDGRLLEKRALPYIVISYGNRIIVLDVLSFQIIAEYTNHSCFFVSLKWSYNSSYNFFAGSNDGHIYKFDISKTDKNKHMNPIWDIINDSNSIVSISVEPFFGNDIIAISNKGELIIIRNVNSKEPSISRVSFEIGETSISYCDYYSLYSNFIIISTKNNAFMYSIRDDTVFNFISDSNIKYAQPLTIKNHILVIYQKNIKILEIDNDKRWICKSSISFEENCSKVNGIESFACTFNRAYIISSSGHINVIEIIRNKLFVTKRFQLLKSEPLGWDIYNGSIAFINKNGMMYITKQTPDAIPSPDDDYYNICRSTSYSLYPEIKKDSYRYHGNSYNSRNTSEKNSNDSSFSNAFYVKDGNRLKWISSSQILCWELKSKNKISLVDIKNKSITSFNKEKLKFPESQITDVKINSDKTICCVIFGNIIGYLFSLINFPKCLCIFSPDSPFLFSFENVPNKALVIFQNNSAAKLTINGTSIESTSVQFKQSKNITSIFSYENGYLFGTAAGEIYECLITNNSEILIKNSITVTNNPIKKILCCENVFLLVDQSNKTFLYHSNKVKSFKTNVKFISFSSAYTFLIHYKNKNKIIVSKISGTFERMNPNLFTPPSLFSHFQWSIYVKKLAFTNLRSAKNLILNLGLPFVYLIIMEKQEDNYESNGISIILKITEKEKKMIPIISLYYSLLNDQYKALEYRLSIDKSNQNYINEILKIVFFGNFSSNSDLINILTMKLIEMNEFSTALEIFVITGNWQKALTLLVESDNYLESVDLMKFKLQKENKEIIELMVSILTNKQQISSLLLIGSIWNLSYLVEYFKNRKLVEISNIFKKLSKVIE